MSDSVTLWTVVLHAPQSMGFSRQEYWSGLPYPPSGDLPDLGIKPASLISPALAGRFSTTSTTWEAHHHWSLVNEKPEKHLEGKFLRKEVGWGAQFLPGRHVGRSAQRTELTMPEGQGGTLLCRVPGPHPLQSSVPGRLESLCEQPAGSFPWSSSREGSQAEIRLWNPYSLTNPSSICP